MLGFAAVNTGNNLLYLMVSALLGFMAISGVLGRWNLARVAVDCLPPTEIFAGVPTLLGIELTNRRRWLPIFLMEVALDGHRVLFPVVEPGSRQHRPLPVRFARRGLHEPPVLQIRSRFPINFFLREQLLATRLAILVYPRPLPTPLPTQADPGGDRGERQTAVRGAYGDISQIRDYQGGEPLRQIHWKLSARHDQLKVKELSAATRAPLLIDLEQLPGIGLEERLGRAAWLVMRLLREGRPVGLQAGAMELSPDSGAQQRRLLLQALAYYGQNPQTA
ncbi:MAG: DUF58 domain-containing protein [Desulfuromonadales bacterium]|nr:DUF58 domain-containing protein [Desulfuromonadales bacterium]